MSKNSLKLITENNILLAKSILRKKLKIEEIALINRNPRNLFDSDIKFLIPLSHYNHWLTMAKETSVEICKYASGLDMDISKNMRHDLTYNINSKAKSMRFYYQRAMYYYNQYQRVAGFNSGYCGKSVELPVADKTAQSA